VKPGREALVSISQWIRQSDDGLVLGEVRQGHNSTLIYLQ